MTLIFWWNFVSLVLWHLVVLSQKIELFDPLKWTETKSSCRGPGLIAGVDRLFLFGTATNLSLDSLWTPYIMFAQHTLQSKGDWPFICRIYLRKCTGDNNTECGCDERDNDNYDLHLNMTVKLNMDQSLYRLVWIDTNIKLKTTVTRKIPRVSRPETETVWSIQKPQALKRSGKCEIPFHPNKPVTYCVRYLRKPFSVRIISWNIRKSEIVSTEIISQGCVTTSSFTESGAGILAFTEFTGCQRRRSQYCSLIAKEIPPACKEEEKLIPKYEVNSKERWFEDKNCPCNVLLMSPVTSIKFCMPQHEESYTLTMFNNERTLNTTDGPCITSSLPLVQGNVTFKFNGSCPTPRLFTCMLSEKGSVNLTIKNHTIDVSEEFCSFILREDVNVSMTICIQETQPPYNVTIVLGNRVRELTNFSQNCVSFYHTPSAATFEPNYQFIFIDRCQNNVTLICSAILFAKGPSGPADDDESTSTKLGGNRSFALVILSIIISVLLSIMCLQVAWLLLITKKWQETEEEAAIENDEGDATGREYFDDVESETTKVTELGYSFLGSEVDSVTTLPSYVSTPN